MGVELDDLWQSQPKPFYDSMKTLVGRDLWRPPGPPWRLAGRVGWSALCLSEILNPGSLNLSPSPFISTPKTGCDPAELFTYRHLSSCVFTAALHKGSKKLPSVCFPLPRGCQHTASGSGSSVTLSPASTRGLWLSCKVPPWNACSGTTSCVRHNGTAGFPIWHTSPSLGLCLHRSCLCFAGERPPWLWTLCSIFPCPGLFYLWHIQTYLSGYVQAHQPPSSLVKKDMVALGVSNKCLVVLRSLPCPEPDGGRSCCQAGPRWRCWKRHFHEYLSNRWRESDGGCICNLPFWGFPGW